ncbi:DUF465 domain-containing protein [Arenicella xantha]|nr:DUF465 domain-containing protein [Arenicella xantha]
MQLVKAEKHVLMTALAELKQEHRELDIAIEEMMQQAISNQFEVGRMKKKKLRLKDSIAKIESRLIPNLHA